ncbi:decaprenyl-phosphate phosphoribosyltransferase [Geobacter pelophilus]|uniref:Decaprenyl-phosphate phosphoribosyltransferase n=1 Tax=Geoanaerobacter pelophilus TaxID=60036 RepID=A0AAW4L0V3_9BACT|nr:decaprenyl-phosphate phosphoribosyltransferase [Geoanaerobacter pelophilus]
MFSEYLKLLRPTQWLKNAMLFFPPFLGGAILDLDTVYRGLFPFAVFCLGSSAGYIFNDLNDLDNDIRHPKKKHRPLVSGKVTPVTAKVICVILLLVSLGLAPLISARFTLYLILYLLITVAYTFYFREVAVLDIFCISSGFVVRLLAGGEFFRIEVSDWLLLTVFLLAVFLSTGKRLSEKLSLGSSAGGHRKTLANYPDGFLDGAMYMTGGAVLVTYTMYVIVRSFMVYSVPLCCFGLLRYIYRIKKGQSGDPTDSLLRDPVLFMVGAAWAVLVGIGIYGK